MELNNPFYRLPEKSTFISWKEQVPDNFLFSVKVSRYISHVNRLKESRESLDLFLDRASGLQRKLGPILVQLPPNFKINRERLLSFLKQLPEDLRFTIEFRHPSWYENEVFDLLRAHNVAFCIYELNYHVSPIITTADFVYIRLHGPDEKYCGSYNDQALLEWIDRLKSWNLANKDVYCYFDNDQAGYAAFNARRMNELMEITLKSSANA